MEKCFISRERTCCFTGHRNRDLPFVGDRAVLGMRVLVSSLALQIEEAVKDGYDTFISGMAEGVDLICAELVYQRIANGEPLRLVCARPYPRQCDHDYKDPRSKYVCSLITDACVTVDVSASYYRGCYAARNRFMVENSSRLIGVIKRKVGHSGTSQTVRLAEKCGLDIHLVELDRLMYYYLGSRRFVRRRPSEENPDQRSKEYG